MARGQCLGTMCRYIPQEILNDDFSALDKANIFMLGASLYELASGAQLPTGAWQRFTLAHSSPSSGPACLRAACCLQQGCKASLSGPACLLAACLLQQGCKASICC